MAALSQPTPQTVARRERSLKMALAAANMAEDNKGLNVVILDLQEQTPIFDYFVIATGSSQRQLRAMSDAIEEMLSADFEQVKLSREGYETSNWIVLDFGPIVVHLFDEPGREYYRLEDLWAAAGRVEREAARRE